MGEFLFRYFDTNIENIYWCETAILTIVIPSFFNCIIQLLKILEMINYLPGMYILLADDTEPGYHTDNAAWQPLLHPYQQVW